MRAGAERTPVHREIVRLINPKTARRAIRPDRQTALFVDYRTSPIRRHAPPPARPAELSSGARPAAMLRDASASASAVAVAVAAACALALGGSARLAGVVDRATLPAACLAALAAALAWALAATASSLRRERRRARDAAERLRDERRFHRGVRARVRALLDAAVDAAGPARGPRSARDASDAGAARGRARAAASARAALDLARDRDHALARRDEPAETLATRDGDLLPWLPALVSSPSRARAASSARWRATRSANPEAFPRDRDPAAAAADAPRAPRATPRSPSTRSSTPSSRTPSRTTRAPSPRPSPPTTLAGPEARIGSRRSSTSPRASRRAARRELRLVGVVSAYAACVAACVAAVAADDARNDDAERAVSLRVEVGERRGGVADLAARFESAPRRAPASDSRSESARRSAAGRASRPPPGAADRARSKDTRAPRRTRGRGGSRFGSSRRRRRRRRKGARRGIGSGRRRTPRPRRFRGDAGRRGRARRRGRRRDDGSFGRLRSRGPTRLDRARVPGAPRLGGVVRRLRRRLGRVGLRRLGLRGVRPRVVVVLAERRRRRRRARIPDRGSAPEPRRAPARARARGVRGGRDSRLRARDGRRMRGVFRIRRRRRGRRGRRGRDRARDARARARASRAPVGRPPVALVASSAALETAPSSSVIWRAAAAVLLTRGRAEADALDAEIASGALRGEGVRRPREPRDGGGVPRGRASGAREGGGGETDARGARGRRGRGRGGGGGAGPGARGDDDNDDDAAVDLDAATATAEARAKAAKAAAAFAAERADAALDARFRTTPPARGDSAASSSPTRRITPGSVSAGVPLAASPRAGLLPRGRRGRGRGRGSRSRDGRLVRFRRRARGLVRLGRRG